MAHNTTCDICQKIIPDKTSYFGLSAYPTTYKDGKRDYESEDSIELHACSWSCADYLVNGLIHRPAYVTVLKQAFPPTNLEG